MFVSRREEARADRRVATSRDREDTDTRPKGYRENRSAGASDSLWHAGAGCAEKIGMTAKSPRSTKLVLKGARQRTWRDAEDPQEVGRPQTEMRSGSQHERLELDAIEECVAQAHCTCQTDSIAPCFEPGGNAAVPDEIDDGRTLTSRCSAWQGEKL